MPGQEAIQQAVCGDQRRRHEIILAPLRDPWTYDAPSDPSRIAPRGQGRRPPRDPEFWG